MTKDAAAQSLARKRAAALTPARRSAIAKAGADARWGTATAPPLAFRCDMHKRLKCPACLAKLPGAGNNEAAADGT